MRLFANDADEEPGGEEPGGEASPDEEAGAEPEEKPEAEQEDYQELPGVLVADSGRILSDAGGGENKTPATVTWKNDEKGKPDPKMEDLRQPMQKTVEDMKTEVPKLESANVNSGKRDKGEPHQSGRAADINNINGVRVVNLPSATGPQGEQGREAAANLVKWAKDKDEVTQIIGPTGWWERNEKGDMKEKIPVEAKDIKTLEEHKNHYHITTKW